MSILPSQKPPNYFRVAWQSALAAGICLGFPAGFLLWLILFRELTHSAVIDKSIALLQTNGLNSIFILAFCSLLWSFLLGRVSGYPAWWKIGLASVMGILVGWFGDRWPVHTLYAVAMCGIIGSVTICVGLAYGLILRNRRAALRLALTTSAASLLGLLLTITLFDQFGVRVGTGNFAMSKVTVASLLMSAILGGMVLGVQFSRFVEEERRRLAVQNTEKK